MMPNRYDPFNMGLSAQFSPGFRASTLQSQHPDADMPSHAYDFNRMLQQHMSDGASMGYYRSNLENIQENVQDENAENPQMSPPDHHHSQHQYQQQQSGCFTAEQHRPISSVQMSGSVLKGASHREGPMNALHDRSLFHSLYGPSSVTNNNELVSSDLTTADMCLSTLYLHELFHRQNRRRSGTSIRVTSTNQQQQQHLWQLPHRDGGSSQMPSSQSSHTRATSSYTDNSAKAAAEKTPLLHPNKT